MSPPPLETYKSLLTLKSSQKLRFFYFLALFFTSFLCSSHSICQALYSALTSGFKKGFLSSKARLAPFSRLARVSELWLSKLGTLSSKRDRWLVERADDTLSMSLHGRFPSRFLLHAKRADVSLSGWDSLSSRTSLSETPAAAPSKFIPFYLKMKWNSH